jgi:quercetin dioxygenase-like cupin family protein
VNEQLTPVHVGPAGGPSLWFLGTLVTIKVDAHQTDGRFSLSEILLPKHAAPPFHTHPQDETFIIVDGEVSVWLDGVPKRCTAGSVACFPGGVPHSFLVESETARMLVISTPAGIERLYKMLGEPTTDLRLPDDDDYPDEERMEAAFAACEVRYVGPPPEPA